MDNHNSNNDNDTIIIIKLGRTFSSLALATIEPASQLARELSTPTRASLLVSLAKFNLRA